MFQSNDNKNGTMAELQRRQFEILNSTNFITWTAIKYCIITIIIITR